MLSGMESMSAPDASFRHEEDAVSHMHIGSVGIFEGPAPPQDTVLGAIAAKLHLVPRLRQAGAFPPPAGAPPLAGLPARSGWPPATFTSTSTLGARRFPRRAVTRSCATSSAV